jgi:predicted Holliday junction resolvase-like endonuclease
VDGILQMAELLLASQLVGLAVGLILGAGICYMRLRLSQRRIRQDALGRSRAVLKGKIGEQMAPVLPEFRYNPADARFLGSPVDYIIFDGYSEAKEGIGKIRRIVLMDVKTGKAKLSPIEKKVKEAVAAGLVEWETLELKD